MLRKSPTSNTWAAILKWRLLLMLNLTKQTIKENKELKDNKNIKEISG